MQSWLIRIIILACAVAHLLGCAERHRDADPGRSADEIETFYNEEIRGKPVTQGTGLSSASAMMDDPSTNFYYAESYRMVGEVAPMGPVEAVTPVKFGELKLGINIYQIQTIRVYFLDQIGSDGRHNHAFVMHITGGSSQPQIFAVANDSNSGEEESSVDDDGVFQVAFPLGNGRLLLESDDTEEGELKNTVQMRLFIDDGQQEAYPIGQISTMVGFISNN